MASGTSGYDGSRMWLDLIKRVKQEGEYTRPRGLHCLELRNVTVVIKSPFNAVPVNTSRRLKLAIGATEHVQLVAGISSVTQLDAASGGNFSKFADNGRLLGAYGPKAYLPLRAAVKSLADDSDTRQAIVPIFGGPAVRGYHRLHARDVPCTISLGFMIRGDYLHMTTHMRSNDLWLGYPYDVFQFTRLQIALAWVLGVEPGEYVHQVDSLHLYLSDREKFEAVHYVPDSEEQPLPLAAPGRHETGPFDWETSQHRFEELRRVAIGVVRGEVVPHRRWPGVFRIPTAWYRDLIAPVGSSEFFCPRCRYYLPITSPDYPAGISPRFCNSCVNGGHNRGKLTLADHVDGWGDRDV